MNDWTLSYEGYDPSEEGLREALCTLGNGYFATRGGDDAVFTRGPAVQSVVGRRPELGTAGGTSDARFIKDYCPVAELGLENATAHKVDEAVEVADLRALCAIYRAVLEGYFPA